MKNKTAGSGCGVCFRIKYVIVLLGPAAATFSFGSGPTVLVCYVRVYFYSLNRRKSLESVWVPCVVEDLNLHMRPATGVREVEVLDAHKQPVTTCILTREAPYLLITGSCDTTIKVRGTSSCYTAGEL